MLVMLYVIFYFLFDFLIFLFARGVQLDNGVTSPCVALDIPRLCYNIPRVVIKAMMRLWIPHGYFDKCLKLSTM